MRLKSFATALIACVSVCCTQQSRAQSDDPPAKMLHTTLHRIHVDGPVEMPARFASAGDLQKQLQRLQQSENLLSLETLRLQSLVGGASTSQIGIRAPVVTGIQNRSGITTRSIRYEEYGTMAELVTRLSDGKVIAEVEYNASFPAARDASDDDDAEALNPKLTTLTVTSTVAVAMGEAVLLQHQQNSDGGILLYVIFDEGRSPTRGRSSSLGEADASSQAASSQAAFLRALAGRTSPERVAPRSSAARADLYERYARSLLAKYDQNEDRVLTKDEVKNSLLAPLAESDADGRVTLEEIIEWGMNRTRQNSRREPSEKNSEPKENEQTSSANENRYRAYARSYFARYDANKDGAITREEKEDGKFHDSWDKNDDGNVTLDEFVTGLSAGRKSGAALSPAKASPPTSNRESKADPRLQRYAEALFNRYDENSDGFITSDESTNKVFTHLRGDDPNKRITLEDLVEGMTRRVQRDAEDADSDDDKDGEESTDDNEDNEEDDDNDNEDDDDDDD